jgi:YidC/Oxa1 family membrane protein insertase
MFLVLVGWQMLFGPKPPEPDAVKTGEALTDSTQTQNTKPTQRSPMSTSEPSATADTDEVSPPEDVAAEEPPAPSGSAAWTTAADDRGRPIEVVTDLFRAEIDPVGGDILQWELTQFDKTDGHPVDLVSPRSMSQGTQSSHALRLVFEDHEVDLSRVEFEANRSRLEVTENQPLGEIRLRADGEYGGQLELIYRFARGHYGIDVEATYQTESSLLSPEFLKVSWPGGIANSEPDTNREFHEFRAVARVGADLQKTKFSSLRGNGDKGRVRYDGVIHVAGVESQYFAALVFNEEPKPGVVQFGGDYERHIQTFSAELGFEREATSVVRYGVYLGPLDPQRLAYYEKEPYSAQTGGLIDLGPSIFHFVAVPTLWALKFLYKIIPNYGLVIIIFSAFTKLLFYPLTKSSTQSMRKMQEINPKLQAIKEKYKDDQQRQSQEMMKLYKEEGVNPMGGCLPLLVQMPVFVALFNILRKTIELRQAEFIWWIDDLSQPDVLFHLPFTLPILGDKFCVLPILMAVSMWLQTKISQSGQTTPAGGGAMAQQMKMMGSVMPIMMFVIFYNSPSGLVLYWFVNTILTAAQTWRIHSKMTPASVTPQAEANPA